jgi:hypothetical protein
MGARRHAASDGAPLPCSTRHTAAPMTRMFQASSALPLPPSAIAADISIRAKAEARGLSPFSPILSPSLFCQLCFCHNFSAWPTPSPSSRGRRAQWTRPRCGSSGWPCRRGHTLLSLPLPRYQIPLLASCRSPRL